MLPDIRPGNTKILYFFNCLLDGMHTRLPLTATKATNKELSISNGFLTLKNHLLLMC